MTNYVCIQGCAILEVGFSKKLKIKVDLFNSTKIKKILYRKIYLFVARRRNTYL